MLWPIFESRLNVLTASFIGLLIFLIEIYYEMIDKVSILEHIRLLFLKVVCST